ncbi:DUF2171 domain-containing protein [Deinococcus sp.]|uniref:DUF2171 domain-containing protein n=1 Tax=Deinococcus sp. TaxID=47478 RepID=UPI003CC57FBC
MRLEDIKAGLMVHALGDGSMGGAPGEHVGTVIGIDGEYLHIWRETALAASGELERLGEVWVPLSWISWTDGRTIHLSKTGSEIESGAQRHLPLAGRRL